MIRNVSISRESKEEARAFGRNGGQKVGRSEIENKVGGRENGRAISGAAGGDDQNAANAARPVKRDISQIIIARKKKILVRPFDVILRRAERGRIG